MKYLYMYLRNAGVYKCTEEGREAFLRFVKNIYKMLEKRQKSEGMKSPEDFWRFVMFNCYDENITKFYVNIKC